MESFAHLFDRVLQNRNSVGPWLTALEAELELVLGAPLEAGPEIAVKNRQHQRVHRAPLRGGRTRLTPGLQEQHLRLRRHGRRARAGGRGHPPDLEPEQGHPPPPTARPPVQERNPVGHKSEDCSGAGAAF